MPTPLEAAAESLAPPAPTTRFFTGTPSVVSQLYTSRRGAESAAAVADEATRLGRSRWDRAAQRRQLIEWGREDQEHAARKDFESQRGEFLSQIALIDPNTDDYEQTKAELLGSLPRPAMEDDAVRAIFAAKDRVFQNRMMVDRQEAAADRRLEDARVKGLEAERIKAAAAGVADEDLAGATTPEEIAALRGAAEREQRLNEQLLQHGLIIERGNLTRAGAKDDGSKVSRADMEVAVMDEGRFPEVAARKNARTGKPDKDTVMTGAQRLDALLNMAAGVADEKKWVDAAGDISDWGKQSRRAVWQEAQQMKKRLGGESAEPPATAPTEPPADAPRKTIGGKTYVQIGGKWFVFE